MCKADNKIISKEDAPEDRSKTAESSPGGDVPKRVPKIYMGGNTIKTDGEGCVMAQSLKL